MATPAPAGILTVDGAAMPFVAGDTLAAALMRGGRLGLRRSRGGEPRGVFCGIGICNECLLTVDGRPNVRACMTEARAGLVVETAAAAA